LWIHVHWSSTWQLNKTILWLNSQAFERFDRREQSADMPTKVWPLHPLCKLSDVTGDKFAVRGKNSNILVALATQHVKKKPLVGACSSRYQKSN